MAGDSDHVEGHVEGQSGSVDGKISDKLLDLADRIPYNSVHESTAAVWENFRVKTENCTTPAELSQQLVWFSKQILPRVLRSSWEQQSSAGCKSSALDLWRDRCGRSCASSCSIPRRSAVGQPLDCTIFDQFSLSLVPFTVVRAPFYLQNACEPCYLRHVTRITRFGSFHLSAFTYQMPSTETQIISQVNARTRLMSWSSSRILNAMPSTGTR